MASSPLSRAAEVTVVDLRASPPPPSWGVVVDHAAVDALADRWAADRFPLPAFTYPGTPADRNERWWFDYVVLSVGVLACLWPPDGDEMWHAELAGEWLDDAPGIFAVFTRQLHPNGDGLVITELASLSDEAGAALFAGRGTLQLIPERVDLIRRMSACLIDRWSGSALNLIDEAGRDGTHIAALLTETMPGYHDRPRSSEGTLPFDKLSHLAAAIMAAGVGWEQAGFGGYDRFPVYPDYMLPRVFRHFGIMRYDNALASAVDGQQLIPAGSEAELAIRWATVYSGEALASALQERGNPVTPPALDYRLWSEAVLGDEAASFGEHHRTITLAY